MASLAAPPWDLISWQSFSDLGSITCGNSMVRRDSYLHATRSIERADSFHLATTPLAQVSSMPATPAISPKVRATSKSPEKSPEKIIEEDEQSYFQNGATTSQGTRPSVTLAPTSPTPGQQAGPPGPSLIVFGRDIAVLIVVFVLAFSAVRAVQVLQSSINDSGKLGVLALTIFYASVAGSVLVLPAILQSACLESCCASPRPALLIGLLLVLLWLAANVAPNPVILLPAAAAGGVGLTLAWSAQMQAFQGFFGRVNDAASQNNSYLRLRRLLLTNNLLFALFQSSHIWGNLGGAAILLAAIMRSPSMDAELSRTAEVIPASTPNRTHAYNLTMWPDWYLMPPLAGVDMLPNMSTRYEDLWDGCQKAQEKWGNPMEWSSPISFKLILGPAGSADVTWVLLTWQAFLGFMALALAALFFHPQRRDTDSEDDDDERQSPENTCCHRLRLSFVAHARQLFDDPHFRLLTPLLFFNGFEQGFLYTDYTAMFSTCLTGLCATCFSATAVGVSSCAFSLVATRFAGQSLRRELTISFAAIVHFGLLGFLYLWKPYPSYPMVIIVLPVLFGLCDSVWQTACYVLITKVASPRDHATAFSNFRILQSLGIAASSMLSFSGGLSAKLFAVQTLLLISLLCYAILENRIRRDELEREDRHRLGKAFLQLTAIVKTAGQAPAQMTRTRSRKVKATTLAAPPIPEEQEPQPSPQALFVVEEDDEF